MAIILRRAVRPRMQNYQRRRGLGVPPLKPCRGMGATLSYYDLLAQANLQQCDPKDVACVSNNVAKQAAVEDLWTNRYMVSGAPADTHLTFTPQTPQQVAEFSNPAGPLAPGSNVVDTSGILSVSGGAGGQGAAPPVAPPPPPPAPKAASPSKAAAASGASLPIVTTDVLNPGGVSPQGSGFSLSSIPWWGWAGAAAVGLYAMRGK
jgi:hypothetical protein